MTPKHSKLRNYQITDSLINLFCQQNHCYQQRTTKLQQGETVSSLKEGLMYNSAHDAHEGDKYETIFGSGFLELPQLVQVGVLVVLNQPHSLCVDASFDFSHHPRAQTFQIIAMVAMRLKDPHLVSFAVEVVSYDFSVDFLLLFLHVDDLAYSHILEEVTPTFPTHDLEPLIAALVELVDGYPALLLVFAPAVHGDSHAVHGTTYEYRPIIHRLPACNAFLLFSASTKKIHGGLHTANRLRNYQPRRKKQSDSWQNAELYNKTQSICWKAGAKTGFRLAGWRIYRSGVFWDKLEFTSESPGSQYPVRIWGWRQQQKWGILTVNGR